jgi:hypothetical protein
MGNGLITNLNSPLGDGGIENLPGFAHDGFFVGFNNASSVIITSGNIEANGKRYTLSSDITHTMTSLTTAFDFHYIYVDDSASTPPTPVIIDTTTEPTFDTVRRGWYNGNDRMVGVVASRDTVTDIHPFNINPRGKTILYQTGLEFFQIMAANQAPTGTWQTPNTNDGSVVIVTPVNAVSIGIRISNSDPSDVVANYISTAEFAAIRPAIDRGQWELVSYNKISTMGWIALGPSRNVKFGGDNDDDNDQDAWCVGFEYTR